MLLCIRLTGNFSLWAKDTNKAAHALPSSGTSLSPGSPLQLHIGPGALRSKYDISKHISCRQEVAHVPEEGDPDAANVQQQPGQSTGRALAGGHHA